MPHVTVEYSANLAETVDPAALVTAVHDAALVTGVAPLDGLRTRAVRRDTYAIADRHPDNAFVAVTARLGAGRTDDDRRRLLEAMLEAVDDTLGPARSTTMLSVEYQEIDPDLRINRNHLRALVAARASGDTDGR